MRVLVACEFSGIVRAAFAKRGHDAWSCDLFPTEQYGQHIQGDVLSVLDWDWDLLIAHPPCTRLCNSGVCWLAKRNLWGEMKDGALFFKRLLDAPIPHIAVENPIPHKYAVEIIGRKYDQTIQPWDFGHMESKRTCLWLNNLPHLQPTSDLKAETMQLPPSKRQRLHWLPKSATRGHERSRTFQGIANAMAEQWG